jgi:FkbM family methyltransferase
MQQMRSLYRNWPTAFADRAGVLAHERLVVYRLRRTIDGEPVRLIASTNRWDVRLINEMWISDFYFEHLPPADAAPGGVHLDVGANRGYFAVYLATRFPKGRVVAFEPSPENVRIARANIAINGLAERVELRPAAAITGDDAWIDLHLADLPGLHTTLAPSEATEYGLDQERYTGRALRVPAEDLGHVLDEAAEANGGYVDTMKLDTEGTELDLLSGLTEVQLRKVKYIVAETEFQHSPEVVRQLQSAGHRVIDGSRFLYALASTTS